MWNHINYYKDTTLKELINFAFTDLMMYRFRKIFKELKLSMVDEKVARDKIGGNWFVQNHKLVGNTTRQGEPIKRGIFKDLPPKTYSQGIYKSLNRLKSFLKCSSHWCPSDDLYKQLAQGLGYMSDDELLRLEALRAQFPDAANKAFKPKRMLDVLPHLKFGGSRIGMLEAAEYFKKQPDGTYSPTGKALRSPRVKLWESYKKDQNKQYEKLVQEASRADQNAAVEVLKTRFSNLKRFFNITKFKDDEI